jgi:hypothetical protein
MKSITKTEEYAGIRCTGSLDRCKTDCANMSARMRGDGGGPVVLNAAVIQRNREKQAQQRKLQERKSAITPLPVTRPLFFERKSATGPPRPVARPLVQSPGLREKKIYKTRGGNVLGGSGGESRLLDRPAIPVGLSVWFKDRSKTCQPILAGGRRHKELAKQRYKIFATKAVCDSRR